VDENSQLREYLADSVILLKNDCEAKGQGTDLAKEYEVRVYPTFALLNQDGEVAARFAGYPGVADFIRTVDRGVEDPRPIEAKRAAFEREPTLDLALTLAQYSEATFANEDAVAFYEYARDQDPQHAPEYDNAIFLATYYGARQGQFTARQLLAAGDRILDDPRSAPDDLFTVASITKRVAPPDQYATVLQRVLDATQDVQDENLRDYRKELLVDAALYLENDKEAALRLKLETMADGWRKDPQALNAFAWWCYENSVALDQGFEAAMQGASLADGDPKLKANILDTAAEIAFARGDVQEAVKLEEQAILLNPEREAFKQTLKKFKEEG